MYKPCCEGDNTLLEDDTFCAALSNLWIKILTDRQKIQISKQTHCGHRGDAGGGGDLTKPIGEALNLVQARPRHGDMGGLCQDDVTR